mmetsp:Transcript_7852/g.17247  ORF Transcript_7852/g.17247 Transcript_7852/m.17247 type:complete len:1246 (+) Transcript_7852:169-3906(+)|eukprot:CAMPEP_0178382788 /NCGR_PEP_ID=MMETSP0689_2-20121128/6670_1 /TAXON_ID=160604 /ORGANISM="Amphidinium massartii, Strain CS-259" /LENGTH=1245 /DNA_ID=CAMNT_0020002995 /DNA_START=100 /DNA_END=3837 /DNA_ORIENTATION=+
MGTSTWRWGSPWILLAVSVVLNVCSVWLNVALSSYLDEDTSTWIWRHLGYGVLTKDTAHDVIEEAAEATSDVAMPWNSLPWPGTPAGSMTLRQLATVEESVSTTGHGEDEHVDSHGDAHTCEAGHGAHDGPHQHDALLFLFNALVVGSAVMHVHLHYPFMQQTVVLFLIGLFFSLLLEGLDWKTGLGVVGESYEMWMGIDPHLLLFTLLPVLLAGDAMAIDTSVAAHVGYQCLYLAGPGVIVQCFIIAGFLKAFLDWTFLLSMVTASMLCATDPVAVVALLKELGASPTLTVQIQGESLLNDGMAIVVFTICYEMLAGKEYDFEAVVLFLVKTAMMAWALGMFIGYFFFGWIRLAGNRLHSHSSMLQISLTLCCAYESFIIAEGVFHVSGVLSCVAASLVLAHHMWPHIVHAETLVHVWHTFEELGNIVIFFLAGALTGNVMVDIEIGDYLRLGVIYLVLVVTRGLFVFISRPILKFLSVDGLPVSTADAAVITWGGLRGAVGVALAIQVHTDRAPDESDCNNPQVSAKDGKRVLFFVSGIAFLTTIVNATTAPALVRCLGITALPDAQLRLLKMLTEQLAQWSTDQKNPEAVTSGLRHMLESLDDQITDQQSHQTRVARTVQMVVNMDMSQMRSVKSHAKATGSEVGPHADGESPPEHNFERGGSAGSAMGQGVTLKRNRSLATLSKDVQDNLQICEKLREAEAGYRMLMESDDGLGMLAIQNQGGGISKGIPADSLLLNVDDMVELMKRTPVDEGMAKVVNRAFLSLVRTHYWKQIETGDLRPGSDEAETLLTSIEVALSPLRADLMDFKYIMGRLRRHTILSDDEWWEVFPTQIVQESHTLERAQEASSRVHPDPEVDGVVSALPAQFASKAQRARKLHGAARLVGSAWFNIGISVVILLNGIWIAIEEKYQTDANNDQLLWLLGDAFFTVIFTVEAVLKLWVLHFAYFKDGSNVFDFVLVVLGILGFIFTTLSYAQGNSGQGDITGIIRISRVFRVLRFLRVFRLFNAKLSRDKLVSHELSCIMFRIMTCMSFIGAHLSSQKALIKYFGGNGKIDCEDEVEIARCIVQSQLSVYKAIGVVSQMERQMNAELVADLKNTLERKEIAEELEEFVMNAMQEGAITSREAESILDPLHHQIADCLALLNDTSEGILRNTSTSSPTVAGARTASDWKDSTGRMSLISRDGGALRLGLPEASGSLQMLSDPDPPEPNPEPAASGQPAPVGSPGALQEDDGQLPQELN